jgi:OmpA-OmpF porin, OOP family
MLLVPLALAGGYSADIELLRPTFSSGGVPTVDSLEMHRAGSARVGLLYQYESDPLVLYQFQSELGAAVANRSIFHLGASVDVSRRLSLRLVLPMAFEWASEVPRLSSQGFGFLDVQVGARYRAWSIGPLAIGPHLDLFLPTGQPDAWRGEGTVRLTPGALVSLDFGRIDVLTDTAVTLRGVTDTGYDYVAGPELTENAAVRLEVWDDRLAVHGGAILRGGLASLGVGEFVVEGVTGLQITPKEGWMIDVGAGKGLTAGYGTTDFRAILGVTWVNVRRPPAPPPEPVVVQKPVESVPDEVILAPEEKPWEETELARVIKDEIVIRDPIQFEYDTDRILPVSMPTLEYVAELMRVNPQILQLVIEGHASEEGSFQYNYNLANTRANAVFRALIEVGVHPDRLSYRSMGEVKPVDVGQTEESLAKNRRVIFSITRRLKPGEQLPAYSTPIKLPWSGETKEIPPPGPLPPEYNTAGPKRSADPERIDPTRFEEAEEEEPEPDPSPTEQR